VLKRKVAELIIDHIFDLPLEAVGGGARQIAGLELRYRDPGVRTAEVYRSASKRPAPERSPDAREVAQDGEFYLPGGLGLAVVEADDEVF
jgi:hypothetical protein